MRITAKSLTRFLQFLLAVLAGYGGNIAYTEVQEKAGQIDEVHRIVGTL